MYQLEQDTMLGKHLFPHDGIKLHEADRPAEQVLGRGLL